MDIWHNQLYECLGILFGGDPAISAGQQNQANAQLIELIGQVQSDVMIDVYVDVLTKAHDANFRSTASSTHALFWAASGLRGLLQLPRAWVDYGSERQGIALNTLLKLLSLVTELDQIIVRQIAGSISCIAVLMVNEWASLFDDLFSACQVSSVETLTETGGNVRIEVLLNILGGIPEYASRVSHLISIDHYNHLISRFHQSAFHTYLYPFIFGVTTSILTGMNSTAENEKVICVAMECLQSWASCDVGNHTVQLVESTSWAPILMVGASPVNTGVDVATTVPVSTNNLLQLVVDLLVNPRGSNSFMKAADVLEQLLLFPSPNICDILSIEPILGIFLQLLQSSNNGDASNELYLRYLSRVFFTLFDQHSEVLFCSVSEDAVDISIYSNIASSNDTSSSSSSTCSPSPIQKSLLEALMFCTRHKQDLEYLAVPSLECWCNVIFSSPYIFDVNLIHQLVNSILETCMLPLDQSEESWLLLRYGGQTASDDYLDGLQCYRADAADTLLALFDMKDKVNSSRVGGSDIGVENAVLDALTACSTSAFNRNIVNEIEVVVWASSQFVEAAIDYLGEGGTDDGDEYDHDYYGEQDDDDHEAGNYYGPQHVSSTSTPTKSSSNQTSSVLSPVNSSGGGFMKASDSPAFRSPPHMTAAASANASLSPHQASVSQWKDWLLQLVQALSSLPLMSSPLLACISSELYKELAPLIEIVRNGELLLCMISNMVTCMTLETASKPAAQCIYRLTNQCSQVFKYRSIYYGSGGGDGDGGSRSSVYHTSLLNLLEQLHITVVPACLTHTAASSNFNFVLRTCIALTCTTYLDAVNESKNLDTAAAEICRFISPRLQHTLQSLNQIKMQQPANYSASSSIQHIEYALGALSSRNNSLHKFASIENAQLSSTLMSLLWNDFSSVLSICEEISQNIISSRSGGGGGGGGHSSSSNTIQSVEVVSLIEDSVFGCLSCLFKLIIIEAESLSNGLFDHVNSLASSSLRKPFRGGRYLPSSLVSLTGLLYDVYHRNNPNNTIEYSSALHDILVVMVDRISNFNQVRSDSSGGGGGEVLSWDIQIGCDSLQSAGVDAAIALCGIVREVMRLSPSLMFEVQVGIEGEVGSEHNRSFIQSLWFLIVVSIHHSCISLNTDRSCSTLIRAAASTLKDFVMIKPKSSHSMISVIDTSVFLDEQSLGFMLNTMFYALGRFDKTSGSFILQGDIRAEDNGDGSGGGNSSSSGSGGKVAVNAFFTRFIADILFTLLYDQYTQPFVTSTCHRLLQSEAIASRDELLSLIVSNQWYENGNDGHVHRQKFMKFVAQVSVVWSGKALPQSAVEILR